MFALAAAFASYFGLLLFCDLIRPEPAGFTLTLSPSGLTVRSVSPGSPGAQAGLQVHDRVLSANGVPVRTRVDWQALEANLRIGHPVRLAVVRQGRTEHVTLVLGRASWRHWTNASAATLLTARVVQCIALVMACLVAFKRPSDPAALIGGWALATFAVYSLVWPYQIAARWRALPSLAGLALWIPFASSVGIAAVMFTFFAVFPRPLLRSRWRWLAAWVPILPPVFLQLRNAVVVVYHPERASGLPDWMAMYATVTAAYTSAAVAALIIGYRRVPDVTQRRRSRIVVIGSLVSLLGMLPAAAGYPWRTGSSLGHSVFASPVVAVGVILALALPISFAYAILRRRLFDVTFIVRRSLQYALARRLLVSIAPASLMLFLLDVWIGRRTPLAEILLTRGWVYGGLAVIAVVAWFRRGEWLEALDRRFFRERYSAQLLLRGVGEDVREANHLGEIAPRVVARVEAALHPEFVTLMIHDVRERKYRTVATVPPGVDVQPLASDSRIAKMLEVLQKPIDVPARGEDRLVRQLPPAEIDALRRSNVELLVPIGSGGGVPEALLALGPKRSEEPYSAEDEGLLGAIGDSLALLLARTPAGKSSPETTDDCPACGSCYDGGTGRCPRDGAALTTVLLPRVLSGRYQLVRRLARGGMGTVYQALDTALDRPVAAKVLREDLLDGPDGPARFQAETRLLAGLVHPNIVAVHDAGITRSRRAFFIMELLEGVTLREELTRVGRLPAQRALHILRGICAGADAAHQRRIIHRDLKPENVLLCRSGSIEVPKILDFGLAKVVTSGHVPALTATGVVVGTPPYMAPEHLRGGEPSTDWDLWAIAVMAVEMLTGTLPSGAGPAGDPSLEGIPMELRSLFARALSVNPINRPTTVAEFLDNLERAVPR
jgi:serine/threonine-protein kinase